MPFDDFDDFELNDEDLDDDAQLTIVDEAKLGAIEKIEEYTEKLKESVLFQNPGDYDANLKVLSRYITTLIDLNELERVETDQRIICEKIKNINLHTETVSYENIERFKHDDEYEDSEVNTGLNALNYLNKNDDDDDDDFDF